MMVKLSEIVQEMDGMGLEVYLHLPSNKIFQYFEGESTFSGLSEKEIAELPKAEQEEAKIGLSFDEFEADFLPFPSKYDIHKYKIMEDFANSVSNTNVQNGLLNSIRGSGAFRRFRNTLDRYNYTPKWYVFREKAFYEIAAEWCVDNHINFEDDRPMPKKSKKRASMEQIIQDWERNAAKKSDQNFQFLTSLKFKSASRVDKVAAEMHEEAFEKIDCKQCANCCKTAKPNLEMDDMERIATHLDMSIEELEHNYLVRDDQEEGKVVNE